MIDSLGGTITYTLDLDDRVATITTPWNAVIGQTYDQTGRPLQLTLPNGLTTDVTFEPQKGRLREITPRASPQAAPLACYRHSYDVRGREPLRYCRGRPPPPGPAKWSADQFDWNTRSSLTV